MRTYGKILTYLSSLAVICQATATNNNATCTEDISNLKKQVTLLQNGLHNLNAFRVVGRDSVFNELKTKLETLTLNYELLERRVDSLAKNDNFTLSNPCDQWSRMPGATKLEFTNTDYVVGTTSYHSIPIDTTTNYNAYSVCYYDDVLFKGGASSTIKIFNATSDEIDQNSYIYDYIKKNEHEYFCKRKIFSNINNKDIVSLAKLDVTFSSLYMFNSNISNESKEFLSNKLNYTDYVYYVSPSSYIKSASLYKQGYKGFKNSEIKIHPKAEIYSEHIRPEVCLNDNLTYTEFNVEARNSKSIKSLFNSMSGVGFIQKESTSLDLQIHVDKYSSKLNLYLVPLKY